MKVGSPAKSQNDIEKLLTRYKWEADTKDREVLFLSFDHNGIVKLSKEKQNVTYQYTIEKNKSEIVFFNQTQTIVYKVKKENDSQKEHFSFTLSIKSSKGIAPQDISYFQRWDLANL